MAEFKKEITVEDLLQRMEGDQEVDITFFVYGMPYANNRIDGINTAAECLEQLNYDCRNARCGRILLSGDRILLGAEIMY